MLKIYRYSGASTTLPVTPLPRLYRLHDSHDHPSTPWISFFWHFRPSSFRLRLARPASPYFGHAGYTTDRSCGIDRTITFTVK